MPSLPSPQPNSTIVPDSSDSAFRSHPTHGFAGLGLPGMNPSSPTSGVVLSIVPCSVGLLKQGRFGPTSKQPCSVRLLLFKFLPDVISPSMKMKEHTLLRTPTDLAG